VEDGETWASLAFWRVRDEIDANVIAKGRHPAMPAYLIGNITVTDPVGYEEYRARVPAVIAAHGGRYVVRGGPMQVLEGDWPGQRNVVLEFPDMQRLNAFYQSDDYAPLLALRKRCAVSNLITVEGYVP
jgi:uncharacterized protein (DUF1330 family)